jgi:peptidoglycan hydrolase-like protein with peptidoglycan-binding domain
MEKSLHKNLYSKRNIKPSYPKINRDIEPTSIETDLIEIDDLPLVTSGNDNTYKRYIISTVAVFGLIISFFISTNNLQNSDQSLVSEIVTESNIPLSSTTSTTLVVTSTSSSTTTSSTTTSLPIKVLSLEDAQSQLYKLGLYIGDIDGILGIETKNAIKEFQKLSGLVVDGILGPKTKSALEKGEDSYVSIGGAEIENVSEVTYSKGIENAQTLLKDLDIYKGVIDGILGIETKNAIKEFQKLSGLVVDGILGPKTKSALEKGEDSYVSIGNQPISSTTSNSALDLRNYNPNAICIAGYVNDMQIWVPDPCFYPVFVFRYGQTAQVNSQAELDAYLNQNWSRTKEKTYNSLGKVSTQNYLPGINSPVNGLPMSPNSNNSIVIGIKNDNNVRARPQSGPQNADAVFEVLVEGGMTRFINIFYQSDISYHGPIRSARPTDPTVLRPLGGVLVASGATGGLIPEINDMGVPVITDRRPDYFRISSRKAPHNLYADTQKLKSTAISKGYKKVNTPQPLFPWGDPTFNNWQTNSFLTLPFSGYTETTWTWNGSTYLRTYYDAYQNQKYDNIHYWSDENGNTGQISFDTVIALFCEPYVHPLQLPSVKTVGEGRAILLHGGKMIDAKWKRGSNLDPFHIFDSNNNILYVPKGKVWISLVPNTKSPSFG